MNRRHEDFQSSALPTELPGHRGAGIVISKNEVHVQHENAAGGKKLSPVAQEAGFLAFPITLFFGFPLVSHALAFCDADFKLGQAARVEINGQGDEGSPLPLDEAHEAGAFLGVDKKGTKTFWFVLEKTPGLAVFVNLGIQEAKFPALDAYISLCNGSLAKTQGFYLGAKKAQASLECLLDKIIVAGLSVDRDVLSFSGR